MDAMLIKIPELAARLGVSRANVYEQQFQTTKRTRRVWQSRAATGGG